MRVNVRCAGENTTHNKGTENVIHQEPGILVPLEEGENMGPQRIGNDILELANTILRAQVIIPKSPASYDEHGNACLCAAGIRAKARLQITNSASIADIYAVHLADTQNKELFFDAFASLNWSQTQCGEIISKNDQADSAQRRTAVAECFEMLRQT